MPFKPSEVQVVTVWCPRPDHPKFRDYLKLLTLQKRTVEHFGHSHIVMTDEPILEGFKSAYFEASKSLMHAILEGQIAYVTRVWSGDVTLVLVDVDCLVMSDLRPAFAPAWEIGLTRRINEASPIQNGAMYFAPGSRKAAIRLLTGALSRCKDHWGGDQEAISQTVAPVPNKSQIAFRCGVSLNFLDCEQYNFSPKGTITIPKGRKFIAHFKGDTKKFAYDYAHAWIFKGVQR